ncbi:MAG TPA: GGDEF domain-containing protein, partial [Myxococcota bacterium]
ATVASTLAQNLRPTDLVARFGGEEFVILFPDSPLAEAEQACERVRVAVASCALPHKDGAPLPPVTISLGVAALAKAEEPAALLKRADVAMYEAKRGGRNRVMCAR